MTAKSMMISQSQPKTILRHVMSFSFAKFICRYYDGLTIWGKRDWSRVCKSGTAVTAEHEKLAESIKPALLALEAQRKDTLNEVERNLRFGLPLWTGLGLVGAAAAGWFFSSPIAFAVVLSAAIGQAVREAMTEPAKTYRAVFKSEIMPKILERFGTFERQNAGMASTDKIRDMGILPDGATVIVDDQIKGRYRGLDVSTAETRVTYRNSDNEDCLFFDGLLVEIELPRPLTGQTLLRPKGTIVSQTTPSNMEPVTLENTKLTAQYDVFTTDQVSARVLFSPAYQERFMALTAPELVREPEEQSWIASFITGSLQQAHYQANKSLGPFGSNKMTFGQLSRHVAMTGAFMFADGKRVLIGVPKAEEIDYFEPPPYHVETDATAMLMHIAKDMHIVLQFADTVLDLDYRTREEAAPTFSIVAAA
jgi:hypothetical protein